jgi:uncharacterized protein
MSYALVTGASKGIGKEIALELAGRKYNLILVARSAEILADLALEIQKHSGVKVVYMAADLAETGVAKKVLDWCKTQDLEVSVLVNNAGYGLSGALEKYSVEENRAMMTLNMLTLTEMCQEFLPMLKRQKEAFILNIASSTAYQAMPLMSIYAASKVFVLNFSRGLKHELKDTSVSVTVVCPGATTTGFNDRADIGAKARKAAARVTMTPQDVAQQAVEGMFMGKTEVITGFINKAGAFLAWLLPKNIIEKSAASIYE